MVTRLHLRNNQSSSCSSSDRSSNKNDAGTSGSSSSGLSRTTAAGRAGRVVTWGSCLILTSGLLLATSVEGFLFQGSVRARASGSLSSPFSYSPSSPMYLPSFAACTTRRPSLLTVLHSSATAGSTGGSGSDNANENLSPTRLEAAATMDPPTTGAGLRRRLRPKTQLPAPHAGDKRNVKLGVLLLQLGGPERTEDVEGFLYNLFADPDIIRLPGFISGLQKPLAYVISKRRAPKSKAAYASIGGGSPIVKYTAAQAEGVEKVLREDMGLDAKCYVAMRYWHPFTDEALEQMRQDGVNSVVVVPLYPQFSISTSGSSLRVLQDLFFKDAPRWGQISHTVVPAWYDRPGYVQAMGRLISRELSQFTEEQKAEGSLHVLFSAHGVPQRYIEMGDPYQEQIRKCVELIAKEYEAPGVTTHLSYQSRVGPIEWLRPYTDDVIEELGASGIKNLVVVPISFVSEHIETLEEIDIEYRELAHENGIKNWRRVPALNTEPGFIEDLAHMVVEALQTPSISVTEACALNNLDIMPMDGRNNGEQDRENNGKLAVLGLASGVVLDLCSGRGGLAHLLH
eukprot:evm.model.NODE_10174_length_41657_cov_19.929615.7